MANPNYFRMFIFCLILFFAGNLSSQDKEPRLSLKAWVGQTIGTDTYLKIVYSRPGVKGRTIWGELVPMGLAPGTKYSKDKPFPWRAGANENTTIDFSKDVTVEGKDLAAGKYGLYMIPGKKEWVIIFSNKNDIWGSFAYDKANDALRITVKPTETEHKEWLSYGFDDLNGTSAVAYLHWEKKKISFKITIK